VLRPVPGRSASVAAIGIAHGGNIVMASSARAAAAGADSRMIAKMNLRIVGSCQVLDEGYTIQQRRRLRRSA
jgi:hypothetical protein